MEANSFVIERLYNVPVNVLWNALTDKEQMKQWYFDIAEFKPDIGFEFTFYGQGHKGEQYLHLCKITDVIINKRLKYSWAYNKYDGKSYVTFELFEEGSQSRLRLTHEGLETFPKNNPDFAKESFTEGWTYITGTALKKFLENK